jgi:hypothetical protein
LVGILAGCAAAGAAEDRAAAIICRGMCDASAVVPVSPTHFIVGDDEDNILRVYLTRGGAPVQTTDLSAFLQVTRRSPEADLEAAAPAGDVVYWISSHARNPDGALRLNRHRFFATTLSVSNNFVSIRPIGRPYTQLLRDMIDEPRLTAFNLAEASRREPKARDALNIEALCATPEGHLLIGFRNPVPGGHALLVPLLNPAEVVQRSRARFGDPLLLDLQGLGVRSLARVANGYMLIAGSADGNGKSHLYSWAGGSETPRRIHRPELAGLNPEAIEQLSDGQATRLLVVSDDGSLKIGGEDCKKLRDPTLKYFRATILDFSQ